jgi:ATP synthase protein I
MSDSNHDGKLRAHAAAQAGRIRKAERERRTLLASTIYLGTLGVMFILPVIVGAYAGNWLDNRLRGYSFSWTITLILLGVFVGATNVYLFIRGK